MDIQNPLKKEFEEYRKEDEARLGLEGINEARKAYRRIGSREIDLANWILNLGSTDLTEISAGGRLDLLWEYRVFLVMGLWRYFVKSPLESDKVIDQNSNEFLAKLIIAEDDESKLVSFHKFMAKGLEKLRIGDAWDIPIKEAYTFEYSDNRLIVGKKSKTGDEIHACNILRALMGRLRFCKECSRPFVAIKRQIYCGPKCSAVVRNRKYWGENKEKLKEARRKKK
jgi:hypothetical protein